MFQLPKDCRVYCAINPALQWGWPEVLANKTNYLLEILAWQKTRDGQRKRPTQKPKIFVPEFMQSGEVGKEAEAHSVDDIKAILAMPRQ